jgi:hypothetical protein
MSLIAMPLNERIPCDHQGMPIGHRDAYEAALTDLMDLINELPESVYHLHRQDAQWILDTVLGRYLSKLARVK